MAKAKKKVGKKALKSALKKKGLKLPHGYEVATRKRK